jgi:hypothetical protein
MNIPARGCDYGRRMDEVMRHWDEAQRDYAAAWRSQPKWAVSRSLKSVGPNTTLAKDDVEAAARLARAPL